MSQYRGKKRNEQSILEMVIVGIFKTIWFLVALPFKGLKLGGKRGLNLEEKKYIIIKRQEIESVLRSENSIELKHAVMEADKLVDYSLKNSSFRGETFADRLKSAKESMPYRVYDNIWKGHKVRNQIAHEQELKIQNSELREAANRLLNYLR